MKKNLFVIVLFTVIAPSAFASSNLGQTAKIPNNWGKSECSKRLKDAQAQLNKIKATNAKPTVQKAS